MTLRRSFLTLSLMAVALSTSLSAQKPDEKKLGSAQIKEIQLAVKAVDDAAAGHPAPNDLGLSWVHEDFLKAQGGAEYVPFTVTIDPSMTTSGYVSVYWRAVAKNGTNAVEPAPTAAKNDKKNDAKAKPKYAYEDIATVAVAPGQHPLKISRSFTVPAGTYDLFVYVRETSDQKNAPALKMAVLRHEVAVPDFWSGDLTTSSVILAERIDPLPAPLTKEQKADRPYALGSMEIIPAFSTKFAKGAEISTLMMIYNPKFDSTNKPNVVVEYNFYAKGAGASEKFFNKTLPQNLNADTLRGFDFAAGHELQAGQAVPLASFPEGDYRLEIKVTDKIANKSLTREITFSVSAS